VSKFFTLEGINTYSGPAYPMFVLFWIYALYLIIGGIVNLIYGNGFESIFDLPLIKRWFGIDEIEIKEGLDEYIDSLSSKDIEWSMLENNYYKEYGLKMFDELNERRMYYAAKRPVIFRTVQGAHTYDILRNQVYTRKFQYIPIQVPAGIEREKYIIDDDDDDFNNCAQSDIVRIALFFPYLSKLQQDAFKFDLSDTFNETLKAEFNNFKSTFEDSDKHATFRGGASLCCQSSG